MSEPAGDGRRTSMKLKSWSVPLAALVFAVFYALSNDRPWLVLSVGLAALWGAAYFWARRLERRLRVEREVDMVWASVGDFIHEIVRVVNDSASPASWVQIVDHSERVLEPYNAVVSVPARSPRTRRLNHRCDRRGLFTLGPTTLLSGDPFGIYSVEIEDPRAHSVLITPPVLALKGVQVPSGGWGDDEERRSSAMHRSAADASVRPYAPGDSLRRVHWRVTARHDELVVRRMESATSGDWWILLDMEGGVQVGEGWDSTLELGIVLAASFAARGLSERRRVGLAFAGSDLVWLEPRSGPSQRWRIMQSLASAEDGDRPLSDLIRLARPESTRSASMIVITPSDRPDWVAALRDRTQRGRALAVLVDRSSFARWEDQSAVVDGLRRAAIPHARFGRQALRAVYAEDEDSASIGASGAWEARKFVREGRVGWRPAR